MELILGLVGLTAFLFVIGMIVAVPLAFLGFFAQRSCPKCAERISKQATRCPKCTSEIGPYERTPVPSSVWWTLGILAFLAWIAFSS